jgi:hypothetical protein
LARLLHSSAEKTRKIDASLNEPAPIQQQACSPLRFFVQPFLAFLPLLHRQDGEAGLPPPANRPVSSGAALRDYDFPSAVAALRSDRFQYSHRVAEAYQNAVVVRGAQQGTFVQRVPVPVGMWHPFRTGGVPLNLSGPGVIEIGNERAAILICHEQLLTWPVLASMLDDPTIVVAMANDCWVQGTSIPRYQANAIRAWARLFGVPIISAVNR